MFCLFNFCFCRPKCIVVMNIQEDDVKQIILKWLEDTTKTIAAGLKSSLEPVTNLTGLHIIREEALKIGKQNIRKGTRFNNLIIQSYRTARRVGENLHRM